LSTFPRESLIHFAFFCQPFIPKLIGRYAKRFVGRRYKRAAEVRLIHQSTDEAEHEKTQRRRRSRRRYPPWLRRRQFGTRKWAGMFEKSEFWERAVAKLMEHLSALIDRFCFTIGRLFSTGKRLYF